MRIFSVFFWHSGWWSSRNEAFLEAVLKRTLTTEHPWLTACDANMSPEDFEEKNLSFRREQMYVMAPEGVSTCRSRSAKGEGRRKAYDYVTACSSLKGRLSDMQVTEDFESRPHKAVTFVVKRGKEKQEWNEQKMPKALPGYSGGRPPGRSVEEKSREEGEEGKESEQRQEENETIEEGIRSSRRMAVERQNPIQRRCSSQIENEEEESWQEDDQMAGHWEEEQHLDDLIERRRMEGSSLK